MQWLEFEIKTIKFNFTYFNLSCFLQRVSSMIPVLRNEYNAQQWLQGMGRACFFELRVFRVPYAQYIVFLTVLDMSFSSRLEVRIGKGYKNLVRIKRGYYGYIQPPPRTDAINDLLFLWCIGSRLDLKINRIWKIWAVDFLPKKLLLYFFLNWICIHHMNFHPKNQL